MPMKETMGFRLLISLATICGILVLSVESVDAFGLPSTRQATTATTTTSTRTIAFSKPPLVSDEERGGGDDIMNKNDDDSSNDLQQQQPQQQQQQQQQLDWKKVVEQSKLFWNMAYPYFEESKAGRWLFAGMIGLTLLNSGVSVGFSYIGKDFWNALSAKNTEEFYKVLMQYLGALVRSRFPSHE